MKDPHLLCQACHPGPDKESVNLYPFYSIRRVRLSGTSVGEGGSSDKKDVDLFVHLFCHLCDYGVPFVSKL